MTEQISNIFILIGLFHIKHFIADYVLQHTYMLRKVRPGWDFVPPLALHCFVHAVLTLTICLFFRPEMYWLAGLDFVVHFSMDRLRSGPNYLGRYDDVNTARFWWILGFDQMVHHMTHLYIVWALITY